MYSLLLLPVISGIIAQLLKLLVRAKKKKFELKDLVAYSGMPSGHSAIVVSLTAIVAFEEGFSSSAFAISLVLAVIVIRDALGIRRYLGEHGRTLNVLVKDLGDDDVLEKRYPHHLEKIGHTPIQVLAGSALGFIVSLVGYFLI